MEGQYRRRSDSSLDSSGAVMLQALYNYQYEAEDGRQVTIVEGEFFQLLRKTNEDWWQVRRLDQPKWRRPFFVPASYVSEVPGAREAPPQKSPLHSGIATERDGVTGECLAEQPKRG